MSVLRVRLFGGLTLTWDQTPLPTIPGVTTRSLLAYLLTFRDRHHTRDLLAGTFWPNLPDAGARRRLSQTLWQIRRILSPHPILLTEGDTVQANPALPLWLDTEQFAIHNAQCAKARGQAIEHCEMCLKLYRGDFLAGYYDDWVLLERERLREMHLATLECAIALYKQEGNCEQALICAQRLAAADPLRESAHLELMRLYRFLERPQAAIEQFRTLRELLAEELGIPPTPASAAFYETISAELEKESPAQPASAPPLPPLLHDLAHLPLVGRANERSTLLYALQTAIQGRGSVALVEGDAGVGKTRLIQEVIANAEWRGLQIGLGRNDPLAASAPHQILVDALSPLLTPLRIHQLADLVAPQWLSAASRLLPSIAEHLPDGSTALTAGLPPLSALDPHAEQQRLWEGLAHCLTALTVSVPLLLVLEDLHWADDATLAALPHLLEHLAASRAFLILSYRTAEAKARAAVRDALDTLDRTLPLLRLRISPLEQAETASLVQQALAPAGATAQIAILARRLQGETGGNALFVVEILKSLLERGSLVLLPAGDWQFPAEDQPLLIPASIQELVGERLAHLDPALRAALELVAVVGEEVEFSALRRASERTPAQVADWLGKLCERGYLAETEIGYRFEHDLVREKVYAAITPGRCQALHRRAATVVETLHPERVELLALHFDRAGEGAKALPYRLQAGERAEGVHDFEGALAHYRRALDLVGDDLTVRWDILSRQEHALDVLSRREEQANTQKEMLCLAIELEDPVRRARTRYLQGWVAVLTGETAEALSLLDKAAELARTAGEQDLLGNCLVAEARAWWRIGDTARCQVAIKDAQRIFQETGNRTGEGRALNMQGNLHLGLTGDYAQALRYFEQAQQVARESRDRYREAADQGNAGITYALLGCHRHSLEVLAKASKVMDLVGDLHWQAIIRHWQAFNYRGLGDSAQAERVADEAVDLCRDVGNRNFEIASLELLGTLALDRQDPAQAQFCFQQSLDVAKANQQTMDQAIQQSHLALACMRLGKLDEAIRLSEEAIATLEDLGGQLSHMGHVYFERYQIVVAQNGPEAGRPLLERAYRHVMDMADRIQDLDLRRSFLGNAVANREIVDAYRRGRPPAPPTRETVRLPDASAPTGRPLRDDEYVTVTWTLSVPEDESIRGRAARRQARLRRLLQEAADQGGTPTIEDLAGALAVSRSTIKRDLAALRQTGLHVCTRGSRK